MPDERQFRPWWEAVFPPAGVLGAFSRGDLQLPWQIPAQAAPRPPAQLGGRAFEALATLTPGERAEIGPIPREPIG